MQCWKLTGAAMSKATSVVFVLAVGCAGGTDRDERLELTSSCIVGGTAEETFLGLDAGETNAVVRLEISSHEQSASENGTCSGVLLADSWVATARHCFPTPEDARATVTFGERAGASTAGAPNGCEARASLESRRIVAHAELDLVLVELSESVSSLSMVATPLAHGGGETPGIGDLVELAGYGLTLQAGVGGRRFVVEPLTEVGHEHFLVDGQGATGACLGDSGGPLLWRNPDGRVDVLGVLSAGSRDCVGIDSYVRLSAAASFMSETLGR